MATKKDAAKAAKPAKKAPVKPAAKAAAPKKPETKAPAKEKAAPVKATKAAKSDAKPSKGDAKPSKRVATGKARVYQPHDTYEVGETIRHPGWNEEGTITELTETPDGLSFIVVDFGSRGCKRLVVDYSLKI